MRVLVGLLVAAMLAGCLGGDSDDVVVEPPTQQPAPATPIVWGDLDAPLRPGSSLGGYCTFNFLFTGTHPNATGPGLFAYIGTAGHCTDEVGERVSLAGMGEIGTVVFDSDDASGADPEADFSLILLDEGIALEANPQMLGHSGPTGVINSSELAVGDTVGLHGYGMVLGQNPYTRDRFGVLTGFDEKSYRADMPAVPGDSGAPLVHLETGAALGVISRFNFGEVPPTTDIGPLVSFILEELAKAGFMVELATI